LWRHNYQNELGTKRDHQLQADVAKQDVSHILALQLHAPLPLADSYVFVALSQPDVGIANVANLVDMPGASKRPAIAQCAGAHHI